jgi:uncharacterized protein (DUF924 family)
MIRLNEKIFNSALYARVRNVWFDNVPSDTIVPPQEVLFRWFGRVEPEAKEKFDEHCRSEFQEALSEIDPTKFPLPLANSYAAEQQQAASIAEPFLPSIESDGEDKTPANLQGLIILLDQMPRNIYRSNQTLIYNHYDRIARSIMHVFLKRDPRPDRDPAYRYSPAFRTWFFLPLMHSEYLEDHEKHDELMKEFEQDIMGNGDEELAKHFEMQMKFGTMHTDLLRKFGRYPHRNEHLNREHTKEEKEYLESGGETFGTNGKKS